MFLCSNVRFAVLSLLGIAALSVSLAGPARAQAYDFSRFVSGGGGGQDPQKKRLATSMGAHVCLMIGRGVEPNTMRFIIASKIPQPNSRIAAVAFDMGRHGRLFQGLAVQLASSGVKARVEPAQPHPFLAGLTPEYWVHVDSRGHLSPEGLGPGRMISITVTLGTGVTVDDVILALNEGLNPVSGANGLRVGVIAMYLLGGPPPGVGTIQDDGGFVTAAPSARCQ